MKNFLLLYFFFYLFIFNIFSNSIELTLNTKEINVKEIIKKSDKLLRGDSLYSEFKMTIIKPTYKREISIKSWALSDKYSFIYILSPIKDRGNVTLKRDKEIWNYISSIDKNIKLPPSMMMQDWMGSDFTNDDLVKESSIVEDYNYKFLGYEKIDNYTTYKIELIPKNDTVVIWGKVIVYIETNHLFHLKAEYYDEDFEIVRLMNFKNVKKFKDRLIPSYMEVIPADKENQKTVIEYEIMNFNIDINENFFSFSNMKRVR
jgi:outer membrane lipoprotein-sorting protein